MLAKGLLILFVLSAWYGSAWAGWKTPSEALDRRLASADFYIYYTLEGEHAFAPDTAIWCLVGPQAAPLREQLAALGVVTAAMHLLADIGHVQAEMGAHALPGDLLALIDIDATRRLRWFSDDAPLSLAVPVRAAGARQVRWSASELAVIFDGAWVCGPAQGWGVDAVASNDADDPAGKLVVIAGAMDNPEAIGVLESRTHRAFARGAQDVATRLVPADLPNWRSVLVCDDPLYGLSRLLS